MYNNLIIERRINISKCLDTFFPNTISKLISEYDYYIEGKSYSLQGHTEYVTCCAVLPKCYGNKIISGSCDRTLKLWNLETAKCEHTFIDHTREIQCVSVVHFDETNIKIVSGSNDKTLKIWNIETGQCEHTLNGHNGAVSCIAVLPDARIVSGSHDCTLKIWNTQTKTCDKTLTGHNNWLSCINVLSDGRIISGSFDSIIKIWNSENGNCENTLKINICIMSIIEIKDDITIATESLLGMWNVQTTSQKNSHNIYVLDTHVNIIPDQRIFYASEYMIYILNTQTGKSDNIFTNYSIYTDFIYVLPDERLVTRSANNTLEIWS